VKPQFRSMPAPSAPEIERVAASDPTNPFYTAEYASACQSLGEQAWIIGLCRGEELVSGCIGFLSGSFLRRSLTIHSLPSVSSPQTFWQGLVELSRELKVWRLQVDTYASPASDIPRLPGELTRRTRTEHVLDLEQADVLAGVSSQHRRNISRAVKAGLSVHRTREASACAQHLKLMHASLERRAKRAEQVAMNEEHARALALLRSRSGELFQAVDGEKVLSSILILRSSRGAYYQTAGTSPEGMKLGASPFLVSRVAAILKQEGSRVFNLGGATADNAGLHRFKAGFGAREVMLEAASFCPKSGVERNVHSALRVGLAWIKH
jgi:GNAT acetyltransferase-like protein